MRREAASVAGRHSCMSCTPSVTTLARSRGGITPQWRVVLPTAAGANANFCGELLTRHDALMPRLRYEYNDSTVRPVPRGDERSIVSADNYLLFLRRVEPPSDHLDDAAPQRFALEPPPLSAPPDDLERPGRQPVCSPGNERCPPERYRKTMPSFASSLGGSTPGVGTPDPSPSRRTVGFADRRHERAVRPSAPFPVSSPVCASPRYCTRPAPAGRPRMRPDGRPPAVAPLLCAAAAVPSSTAPSAIDCSRDRPDFAALPPDVAPTGASSGDLACGHARPPAADTASPVSPLEGGDGEDSATMQRVATVGARQASTSTRRTLRRAPLSEARSSLAERRRLPEGRRCCRGSGSSASEQGSSPSEHVVSACGAGERISCIAPAEEGEAERGRPSVTAPSATPSTTPSTTATRRRRAVSSAGPLSRGEARAPDLLSIEERTAPKLPLRSQALPPRANSGRLLPVRLTRLQPGVPKLRGAPSFVRRSRGRAEDMEGGEEGEEGGPGEAGAAASFRACAQSGSRAKTIEVGAS